MRQTPKEQIQLGMESFAIVEEIEEQPQQMRGNSKINKVPLLKEYVYFKNKKTVVLTIVLLKQERKT